jgi:hypothetical protein
MITSPPSAITRRHNPGVIDTRVSPVLISFGTPMVIKMIFCAAKQRHSAQAHPIIASGQIFRPPFCPDFNNGTDAIGERNSPTR